MERINSSSAQSWAIYKKVQDLFGQTQGGFNFDGTFTTPSGQKTLYGNDFADFLLGDASPTRNLRYRTRVSGTTSHGLRMFKTTGVSTNA